MNKMLTFTKLFVMLSIFCVAAIAAPYQELPPKPGYIPVYIREGNTPLSKINPKLVEAFHEDEDSLNTPKEQETPKETQVAKDNEKNPGTENIKRDGANNEIVIGVNDTEDNAKQHQQKSHEETEKQEQFPASDIAKFTSDDIKTFAHDSLDHKTKQKINN